jgi:hypothetical protein
VGVNSVAISTPETPFGSVKEAGHGHEGCVEWLEVYTAASSSRRARLEHFPSAHYLFADSSLYARYRLDEDHLFVWMKTIQMLLSSGFRR